MGTCFVIQPFDKGMFDKRYDDVYRPAIEAASLEPYRVDKDPAVDVPIDAIERGIQSAEVCLADITRDNPNVWYELGYAFAIGKSVVMVCGPERQPLKFPFDIQHRSVITYQSESMGDFRRLQEEITAKMLAAKLKIAQLRELANTDPIAPSAGLSPHELMVLADVATETSVPGSTCPTYRTADSMKNAGLTPIGFSLSLRKLVAKKMLLITEETDFNGNEYNNLEVTEDGWKWIEQNSSLFVQKRDPPAKPARGKAGAAKFDDMDDIPF